MIGKCLIIEKYEWSGKYYEEYWKNWGIQNSDTNSWNLNDDKSNIEDNTDWNLEDDKINTESNDTNDWNLDDNKTNTENNDNNDWNLEDDNTSDSNSIEDWDDISLHDDNTPLWDDKLMDKLDIDLEALPKWDE